MLQSIRWLIPTMTNPTSTDALVAFLIIFGAYLVQQYILKSVFLYITHYFTKHNKAFLSNVWHHLGRMIRHVFWVTAFFVAASYLVDVWLLQISRIEKVYYSIVFFFLFKAVYDLLNYYTAKPAKIKLAAGREAYIAPYMIRIVKAIVIILGIFSVAAIWSFNLNGFLTGIGLTSVALAFGVRDTSSHIFGGLSVGLDKPFQIGDWIATDDQKLDGTVQDINLRSTLIDAGEKGTIYVPNAYLMNRPIYNYSKREKMKTELYLYIANHNSEETVRAVCEEIHEQIMLHSKTDKQIVHVFIDDLKPGAFRLLIRFYVQTTLSAEHLEVRQDILFAVHDIFTQYNIQQVETHYTHESL